MKLLAKHLGGSHAYGLATPTSDRDERSVYMHTEPRLILGLARHDHVSRQKDGEDSFGWELRHFLGLLKQGNTMCLEMLWNDEWIYLSPEFQIIQSQRNNLIDSHQLFKCLMGYCQSEKYGYSPKNLVEFLRLCRAGDIFFRTGEFPINIRKDPLVGELLFDIKTNPGQLDTNQVESLMAQAEIGLKAAYDNIQIIHNYDQSIADEICLRLYYPELERAWMVQQAL